MIDRPELIRDVIAHFIAKPGYTVLGESVTDLLSGDLWNYADTPRLEIRVAHKMFANGNTQHPFIEHVVVPGVQMQFLTATDQGGIALAKPALADGEVPDYEPVSVHFIQGGDYGGITPLPATNIDVNRLTLTKNGISLRSGLIPAAVTGMVTMQAIDKKFEILGPLSQADKELLGRLVNRGWSCPPEQLAQLGGAIEAMAAAPVPGVDAAGVLPDITPVPVLEPIPLHPVPPAFTAPPIPAGIFKGPEAGYDIQQGHAMPKKAPGLTGTQRRHEAEIHRVHEIRENFVIAHMTPDEKVGAAHGQDIGEFAQVYDANTTGFGAGAWE